MLKMMIKLIVISLCGHLIKGWFPISHPFHLSAFLVEIIINPLDFFAASFALLIAVVLNAQIFRELIQQTIWMFKRHLSIKYLLMAYTGLLLTYYFLFQNGWEMSIILFSFSFLYGMISLEL